jgi:hypothetical protein
LTDIVEYCEKEEVSITYDYEHWLKVSFALGGMKIPEEEKISLFLRLCRLDGENHYEQASKLKIEHSIENATGEITIGTVFRYAKEFGYEEKPKNVFWYEEKKRTSYVIKLDQYKYIRWLIEQGFSYDKGVLYQKKDYLLSEKSYQELKNYILNYLEGLPDMVTENCSKFMLIGAFLNQNHMYTSKSKLEFLKPEKIKLHWDTPMEVNFYFRNGIVEVSANDIKLLPYEELNECVFEKDIIDFEIKSFEMDGSSNFLHFLYNITDSGNILNSVGGFLSRYKNPLERKVLILIDDDANKEEANGGRGKSLVFKSLEELRNVVTLDGKNIREDHFMFQSIETNTNIVLFDDLREGFNFDNLFSPTVSDLTIERKGVSAKTIPFHLSPKFAITTNHPLDGKDGGSGRSRKHIVKINKHYGEHRTPEDEFEKPFFSMDETFEEKQDFYNTMFSCVQIYLSDGLGESDVEFEKELKFKKDTCSAFVKFVNDRTFKKDKEYELLSIMKIFVADNPSLKDLEPRTFYKWIRQYIRYKGYKTLESQKTDGEHLLQKRNGKTYFQIV